jgi:hypothetical protein
MRLRNKIYGTSPLILHCPNKPFRNQFLLEGVDPFWPRLISNSAKIIRLPENIKIITFNNRSRKSLLEKKLDILGVNYLVLGKNVSDWYNRAKIRLLVENLGGVREEFILVLDSDDVLIMSSLEDIIKKFIAFDCEVLFNSEPYPYPLECFYSGMEKKICKEPFCYLNSGCFIGRTEFCRKLYRECFTYRDSIIDNHAYSDQIKIKPFYIKMYPQIKIDFSSEIFQILPLYYENSSFNYPGVCFQDVFQLEEGCGLDSGKKLY